MNKVIEADFLPRGTKAGFFLVTLIQATKAALALHVLDEDF